MNPVQFATLPECELSCKMLSLKAELASNQSSSYPH